MHLPVADMVSLHNSVSLALEEAFLNKKQSEPQLIANLVAALPKHINQMNLSGSIEIKAGGVFVHAQPFVTCKSFPEKKPGSVEIGDLLLIRTLVTNSTVKEQRALLLQAKKVKRIPARPDNQNQWHLYEQWSEFSYAARSVGLIGQMRLIKEPDMYDAAKYLLIDVGVAANSRHRLCCLGMPFLWPESCLHHTAQPTKFELSRYRCFFSELVDFLSGNAGKPFDKNLAGTIGWDQVIQDLIYKTTQAKTVFMGRAVGQGKSKSHRESGLLFITPTNASSFFEVAGGGGANDSSEPPTVPNEWGDDGGISIIEIVVEQEG